MARGRENTQTIHSTAYAVIAFHRKNVPIGFRFGDLELFSVRLRLRTGSRELSDASEPPRLPLMPSEPLGEDEQGFLIRALPLAEAQPRLRVEDDYLCYIPLQYQHYYINLDQSFEDYQKHFSGKTLSTLRRKVRKFRAHCEGRLDFRAYNDAGSIKEFFDIARIVSEKTYQERLFDSGLPQSEDYIEETEALARENRIRAYLLFDGDHPVSYLFCPVVDGVVIYAYLGFDPAYRQRSPGTVLQWLALEQLFADPDCRFFDFTEGESAHKKLFATHHRLCGNVYFLRPTLVHHVIVRGHMLTDWLSASLGNVLSRIGLKTRLKRYLRFGRQ